MKFIIDQGMITARWIYNFSDLLLNSQPYRNQEVEIAIFTTLFIANIGMFLYGLLTGSVVFSFIAVLIGAPTLWIIVTMMYALDQMNKFKECEGNEDKDLDNCATNLCVIVRAARHADYLECKGE